MKSNASGRKVNTSLTLARYQEVDRKGERRKATRRDRERKREKEREKTFALT